MHCWKNMSRFVEWAYIRTLYVENNCSLGENENAKLTVNEK